MSLFTPGRRVVITHPCVITAMRGHSGVVESVITPAADNSRGVAAIIRMDQPATLRHVMFYAAECSPLDPQQASLF